MQDELRKKVKLLGVFKIISYKDLAAKVELKMPSMYSWLAGNYDLGFKKFEKMTEIVSQYEDKLGEYM